MTEKKKGANSRRKGAEFERKIANELFSELGITFSRNLEQYQKSGLGDLTADDDAFPFVIECKAYASGTDCMPAWEVQAFKAAKAANKHPAVIWKFNNRPVRVRVWLDAVSEAYGAADVCTIPCDLSIMGFAYVAREIMARRATQ